jgi:Protein of unknown function (DUF1501)
VRARRILGGGVRAGQTVGETNEIGFNPGDGAIHVHDLQATILALLGMNHRNVCPFDGEDLDHSVATSALTPT